jgi:hypothetical protein
LREALVAAKRAVLAAEILEGRAVAGHHDPGVSTRHG